MKPRAQDDESRLAEARWELLVAQLDHNFCDARKFDAMIKAIEGTKPTNEDST
jgi:hypothetical protein